MKTTSCIPKLENKQKKKKKMKMSGRELTFTNTETNIGSLPSSSPAATVFRNTGETFDL